jgi:hypothetical protein
MIQHRITHRVVGEDPIVCLLKESDYTDKSGSSLPEVLQAQANSTYEEFVAAARQLDKPSLVEHELIDTQAPEGTPEHIRSLRSYQA